MVAVRDADVAARSIGLNPVSVKATAFMLSAVLAGIAGGIFASLLAFVAPDSFPFSQSILFLLHGRRRRLGARPGDGYDHRGTARAVVESAVYRLLFFGLLLLVALARARSVLGTVARLFRRVDPRTGCGGLRSRGLPGAMVLALRWSFLATSESPSAASSGTMSALCRGQRSQ
jgi:hypothetical protein